MVIPNNNTKLNRLTAIREALDNDESKYFFNFLLINRGGLQLLKVISCINFYFFKQFL